MITIGNFFFRYRNGLFLFLYALLFLPSAPLFNPRWWGPAWYYWPLTIGLLITLSGELVRGATIGLAYIIRGGKNGKVYAEALVTTGIFRHCRNPLYVGNILMLLGVGILANSFLFVVIVMPLFGIIYHAIVLAEERFLRGKFGSEFDRYSRQVNRWVPSLRGLPATFGERRFNWKRWLLKEYNTQYIWLSGIALILLLKYPVLTGYDSQLRNTSLTIVLPALLAGYLFVRYLKKSGKLKE